jgi:3-dehydroquinate synthase
MATGPDRPYDRRPMDAEIAIVEVALPGRAYSVEIASGLTDRLGARLRELSQARQALLVTDSNVGPLYAAHVAASLSAAGFAVATHTVPAGDASKSLEEAARLYDRLADSHHGRFDPVIALGGGMTGDLAGFAAATWMRGVPFVQCPTTLLADIDASVGGKTAVNHPGGKNMVGAFHQPLVVCIDVDCLRSLDDRDYRAGLAESVKHAVIRDETFLRWHEDHAEAIIGRTPEVVCELIRRNCAIKAAVVVEDERETATGDVGRAALNFGHTVGHAIEAASRYALHHGEAVALGMVAALDLAVRDCGFPESDRCRVESLIAALGLPIRSPLPLAEADLMQRMRGDKKVRHQVLRLAVPSELGAVRWLESPSEVSLAAAIRRVIGL